MSILHHSEIAFFAVVLHHSSCYVAKCSCTTAEQLAVVQKLLGSICTTAACCGAKLHPAWHILHHIAPQQPALLWSKCSYTTAEQPAVVQNAPWHHGAKAIGCNLHHSRAGTTAACCGAELHPVWCILHHSSLLGAICTTTACSAVVLTQQLLWCKMLCTIAEQPAVVQNCSQQIAVVQKLLWWVQSESQEATAAVVQNCTQQPAVVHDCTIAVVW
ncbi:hypothetical protein MANES_18G124900v8 [Manihot esculenta]|uniref:Uncharacterized protein n=1 Tax=Manihot esculenta TaxID=3983 RepID=A0ACB7G1P0_MANES|nr:hypothetical protein MANES_18G124900v8 [Manihot esculenta]